jgi:hypothetical protein
MSLDDATLARLRAARSRPHEPGRCGSPGEAGSRFAGSLLTVVASCGQHGFWLLDFVAAAGEAALRGSPIPSRLSGLQGR